MNENNRQSIALISELLEEANVNLLFASNSCIHMFFPRFWDLLGLLKINPEKFAIVIISYHYMYDYYPLYYVPFVSNI